MGGTRRVVGTALKAKVAWAAARGDGTTAEASAESAVHPNQVSAWKGQLFDWAAELFADGRAGLDMPTAIRRHPMCRLA